MTAKQWVGQVNGDYVVKGNHLVKYIELVNEVQLSQVGEGRKRAECQGE